MDFSVNPATMDAIPVISHQVVEQAARAVVQAAAAARRQEFVEQPPGLNGGGYLMDIATGDYYERTPEGRWRNAVTGELPDRDPREIDPGEYEWVVERYVPFHERWPAFPQAMKDYCTTAKKAIQDDGHMSAINQVKTAVDRWGGYARQSFSDNFLAPFLTQSVPEQQFLLDELAVEMVAYEAILRQGRLDAKAVADATVAALESLEQRLDVDVETLLGMVGLVVTIASAVVTVGTATAFTAAVTFGLINAGLAGAKLAASFVDSAQSVTGFTVDEVLGSMAVALDNLRQAMDFEEDLIAAEAEKLRDQVAGWLSSDDPLEMATILPNEPTDDGIDDLTSGGLPSPVDFRPRR